MNQYNYIDYSSSATRHIDFQGGTKRKRGGWAEKRGKKKEGKRWDEVKGKQE